MQQFQFPDGLQHYATAKRMRDHHDLDAVVLQVLKAREEASKRFACCLRSWDLCRVAEDGPRFELPIAWPEEEEDGVESRGPGSVSCQQVQHCGVRLARRIVVVLVAMNEENQPRLPLGVPL